MVNVKYFRSYLLFFVPIIVILHLTYSSLKNVPTLNKDCMLLRDSTQFVLSPATVVTGYFHLDKAKKSHSVYQDWMSNFLMMDTSMVIFCDKASYAFIESRRRDKADKTVIEITSIDDFYTNKYKSAYEQHFKKDHESKENGGNVSHSVPLYMIWGEKLHFVKQVIDKNPFCSEYFFWLDIGMIRKPNTKYVQWPNAARIAATDKNKVTLVQVLRFTTDELAVTTKQDLPSFQFVDRIGGTFSGGAAPLLRYHDLYYDMLEHFVRVDRFIGKDQSIMNSVYLTNRDMFEFVTCARTKGCEDQFFVLLDHFASSGRSNVFVRLMNMFKEKLSNVI
jgi:hypothetical protein